MRRRNSELASWRLRSPIANNGKDVTTGKDIIYLTNFFGVDTAEMFFGASSFDQNIDSWALAFTTDMTNMFRGASSYNQGLESWYPAYCTRMVGTFRDATSFNQDLTWTSVLGGNCNNHACADFGESILDGSCSNERMKALSAGETPKLDPDQGCWIFAGATAMSDCNKKKIFDAWKPQGIGYEWPTGTSWDSGSFSPFVHWGEDTCKDDPSWGYTFCPWSNGKTFEACP